MKIEGIILFGDSVFFGYGASDRNKGCGRILKNLCKDIPISINARNNDSTKDALKKIKENVLAREEYSHIFVFFGNNDSRLVDKLIPVCTVEEFRENLEKIISQIRGAGKSPILCNLQPIDDALCYKKLAYMREYLDENLTPDTWHKKYSDEILSLSSEAEVPVVDIETELRATPETMYKDGLHPNDRGHDVIAHLLLDEIRKQELA